MIIFLWVIGAVLVASLMLFMAYASTIGGVGIVTRSRYERCPHCGHHGLVHEGQLHAAACPPSASSRVGRLVHSGHGLHFGHH